MITEKNVVLVTGASRGIGKAIASLLGESQQHVVIGTATTQAGAERISEYFQQSNIEGCGMCLDVTDLSSIKNVISDVSKQYGAPLILVNNAGVTEDNLFVRMKPEQWQKVIETNLSSVFHMTQSCLRGMLKKRWGRVVTLGSVVAHSGNPGQVNYCAAKAGLIGATKSMALEYANRGITFNVIAPGFIDTDMTEQLTDDQQQQILQQIPMQRMGEPQDIAKLVEFLISPAANYITGQTIHVNGGMFMN